MHTKKSLCSTKKGKGGESTKQSYGLDYTQIHMYIHVHVQLYNVHEYARIPLQDKRDAVYMEPGVWVEEGERRGIQAGSHQKELHTVLPEGDLHTALLFQAEAAQVCCTSSLTNLREPYRTMNILHGYNVYKCIWKYVCIACHIAKR